MYAFVIWMSGGFIWTLTHARTQSSITAFCQFVTIDFSPRNQSYQRGKILQTSCTSVHLDDCRSGDQLKVWYAGNWHLLCLMTKCTGGRRHHLYSYLPLRVTGNSDSKESGLHSSGFVIEQKTTIHSLQDWYGALIYGCSEGCFRFEICWTPFKFGASETGAE